MTDQKTTNDEPAENQTAENQTAKLARRIRPDRTMLPMMGQLMMF